MRRIIVHYGDLAGSVRAAMIFPEDPQKARILVGWHLAGGALEEFAKAHTVDQAELFQIARDANTFQGIRNEVEKREFAGQQAGAVMFVLWALITGHTDVASIENAILQVEQIGNARGLKTHSTTYRKHLKLFQPVLHLWAESSRRASLKMGRWFSSTADVGVFVTNAMIIADQLKAWNGSHPNPSKLLDEFICPYEGWSPCGNGIPAVQLAADLIPTRKKKGRPRKPSRRQG
jgi:hypothetical protein